MFRLYSSPVAGAVPRDVPLGRVVVLDRFVHHLGLVYGGTSAEQALRYHTASTVISAMQPSAMRVPTPLHSSTLADAPSDESLDISLVGAPSFDDNVPLPARCSSDSELFLPTVVGAEGVIHRAHCLTNLCDPSFNGLLRVATPGSVPVQFPKDGLSVQGGGDVPGLLDAVPGKDALNSSPIATVPAAMAAPLGAVCPASAHVASTLVPSSMVSIPPVGQPPHKSSMASVHPSVPNGRLSIGG